MTSATNYWTPHSGSYGGNLQVTATPVDSSAASTGYDKWSQILYADIVQPARYQLGLQNAASVTLDLESDVRRERSAFKSRSLVMARNLLTGRG